MKSLLLRTVLASIVVCSRVGASPTIIDAATDLEPYDSTSVHFVYGRHFDYDKTNRHHHDPYPGREPYRHQESYSQGDHYHRPASYEHESQISYHGKEPLGFDSHRLYGHGYKHKEGYHHDAYRLHGAGNDYHPSYHPHEQPHHHGFVPVHQPEHRDHGHGYAYGHDAIGPFSHFTGPYGPFGFYANFYHDL